jgi:hypothetical protein
MPDLQSITKDNLRKLVRWGRVAFAARCGRRVQPLLRRWGEPQPGLLDLLEKTLTLTEQSAATARVDPDLEALVRNIEASFLAVNGSETATVGSAVAHLACAVATTAVEAGQQDEEAAVERAGDACLWAEVAALQLGVAGIDKILKYDFSFLAARLEREGLTENMPVSPESFALE